MVLINGCQETWRMIISPFLMIVIMPGSIGLAATIANSGTSLSGVYWSEMATALVNPSDQPANIAMKVGSTTEKYFGSEVAQNMPYFIFVNAMVYFGLMVIVLLLENPYGIENRVCQVLFCRGKKASATEASGIIADSDLQNKLLVDQSDHFTLVQQSVKKAGLGNDYYHDHHQDMLSDAMTRHYATVSKSTKNVFENSHKLKEALNHMPNYRLRDRLVDQRFKNPVGYHNYHTYYHAGKLFVIKEGGSFEEMG